MTENKKRLEKFARAGLAQHRLPKLTCLAFLMLQKRHWHTSTLVFPSYRNLYRDIIYDFDLSRLLLLVPDMDNKRKFLACIWELSFCSFAFDIWLRTRLLGSPFLSLVIVAF